jgi:hypothetical protein
MAKPPKNLARYNAIQLHLNSLTWPALVGLSFRKRLIPLRSGWQTLSHESR